jgi:hypothetical protein
MEAFYKNFKKNFRHETLSDASFKASKASSITFKSQHEEYSIIFQTFPQPNRFVAFHCGLPAERKPKQHHSTLFLNKLFGVYEPAPT